jgi:predicted transcriptional regulator
MAGTITPEPIRRSRVSRLSGLKETLNKLADATLLQKGALAEQAIKEAIAVIEEHEDRLYKVERYIRGQYAE